MNKDFQAFFEQNGFEYDKKEGFHGKLNGYEMQARSSMTYGYSISVAAYISAENLPAVQGWLKMNAKSYGIVQFNVTRYGLGCGFNAFSAKKMLMFATGITEYLKQITPPDSCPFCGNPLEGAQDVHTVGEEHFRFQAHEHCFDEYLGELQTQENAYAAAPSGASRGIIGAVLGALVGCVLWAALYFIGYLAMIAPFVGALVAGLLWDKFGGKNGKAKIIAVWVATVVLLTVTIVLCYHIDLTNAIKEVGTTGTSWEWFKYLYETDEEFRGAVIRDLVLSYVFIIAGNVFVMIRILRTQKKQSSVLKKF